MPKNKNRASFFFLILLAILTGSVFYTIRANHKKQKNSDKTKQVLSKDFQKDSQFEISYNQDDVIEKQKYLSVEEIK